MLEDKEGQPLFNIQVPLSAERRNSRGIKISDFRCGVDSGLGFEGLGFRALEELLYCCWLFLCGSHFRLALSSRLLVNRGTRARLHSPEAITFWRPSFPKTWGSFIGVATGGVLAEKRCLLHLCFRV